MSQNKEQEQEQEKEKEKVTEKKITNQKKRSPCCTISFAEGWLAHKESMIEKNKKKQKELRIKNMNSKNKERKQKEEQNKRKQLALKKQIDFETHLDLTTLTVNPYPPLEKNAHLFKMVIVVNTSLGMKTGKIGAQCSHATLGAYKLALKTQPLALQFWENQSQQAKIALCGRDKKHLKLLKSWAKKLNIPCSSIKDAGRTQIASGSMTALAIGPAFIPIINQITGHLKLL
ncbi:peptidyl-tRNA hydrolase 2 [Anaeramoeba flamelloides]|uniref:peptidyl-tRNA hydrolase n=1 Tax=Anaeramoeba flamelloides TaxID=1746091 RepID=A0ABQ8X9B2_9EUKA|nr:peptidyl-tRNA hydrolase 2 [Anaeramoeba flamelloides]